MWGFGPILGAIVEAFLALWWWRRAFVGVFRGASSCFGPGVHCCYPCHGVSAASASAKLSFLDWRGNGCVVCKNAGGETEWTLTFGPDRKGRFYTPVSVKVQLKYSTLLCSLGMATNFDQQSAGYPHEGGTSYPVGGTESKGRNTVAIVALVLAIVGFIFACIPGALIVGWILLPISFVVALVSLFMKDKKKGLGITALIVSIVGTVVGVIVFLGLTASAVDEAFSGEETTAQVPAEQQTAEATGGEEADSNAAENGNNTAQDDQGTRANPYPLGTEISQGDWTVAINGVTPDATDQILAENQFNEPPAEGSQYLMVNITATYNGTDPEGATPWVRAEYVTADGNTISSSDAMVVEPDSFDSLSTLYEGASTTGNYAFAVPSDTALEGTVAITPDMFGDKAFFAVQ